MISNLSLQSLCHALNTGTLSTEEMRTHVHQSAKQQQHLSIFIPSIDGEMISTKPDQAKRGKPLFALPVAYKDNISVVGYRLTAGTPGMADCMAKYDADIVKRFAMHGAIVAGKTNMHELSCGVTSLNLHFGAVGNPAAPGYCAGGSSGGSAAAVAAGIVPVAVGTDTGGSVRIPAAFCGITGFRPTTGCFTSEGIIPVSRTKDTPGLLTRTAEDACFLQRILMHVDRPLNKMPCRIGLPTTMWSALDDEVRIYCQRALDRLTREGYECVAINDRRINALNSAIVFTLPRYEFLTDFPRALLEQGWGHRINDVINEICDPAVRHFIHNDLSCAHYSSATDYITALGTLARLRDAVADMFVRHQIDILAYPTVPCAVPHLSAAANPDLFARIVRNTELASNAALPSITLPVAPTGYLPVGLNIDGAHGSDSELLATACHIEHLLAA
ncbi:amidase family protein [Pectobacterium odoriferum]|uniref:Amidase n=1 Tax=Pectobacterium odoriferum TaxID=78398 RepID=A0ABD6VR61_9GAMM|nr:amidase family protein [Pectobacterium odoriferum]AIU89590.1 indole acetimide hydrolase [Pectobacterium odoriferum]MBA0189686.1 amidase [Pectobacterium odoriferum]MCA6959602.1 amidase [Pectobacterium odoriferum]MCH5007723.1 amidase [Pectobacterium odoriferum]POD93265.1 amidase [Pectobacterium odoriferum]